MTFPYASIALACTSFALALALGSACTGSSQSCETGACFCDDCGEGTDAAPLDDAGCPSGTVLLITTNANGSTPSGCYASASCGAPIPSGVGPTTWSGAQQECASYPDSLISTTPCDGFVALVPGSSSGEPDASILYAESDVYDVTTGALVAVIGPGPGSSYVCDYGEVAIPLDCLAPLTKPTTPCASFDAGLED